MPLSVATCTIPAGESVSDSANTSNGKLEYICMPSKWTTAVVTFQLSHDDKDWFDLFDLKGNEVGITFSPGGICYLTDFTFDRVYIRVRSGWRDKPIVQEASRQFAFAFA